MNRFSTSRSLSSLTIAVIHVNILPFIVAVILAAYAFYLVPFIQSTQVHFGLSILIYSTVVLFAFPVYCTLLSGGTQHGFVAVFHNGGKPAFVFVVSFLVLTLPFALLQTAKFEGTSWWLVWSGSFLLYAIAIAAFGTMFPDAARGRYWRWRAALERGKRHWRKLLLGYLLVFGTVLGLALVAAYSISLVFILIDFDVHLIIDLVDAFIRGAATSLFNAMLAIFLTRAVIDDEKMHT